MHIPASFLTAQAAAFQDKTIVHRPKQTNTGALGSVTISPGAASETTYLVNFQLLNDKLLADEWGLALARDALMTRSTTAPIVAGDYVQYGGVVYLVVGVPSHDSHYKWLLKATGEAAV